MIIFPGHIAKIETLKDRSIKVTLETMELGAEKSGQLMISQNMSGVFAFKAEQYTEEEINEFDELKFSVEVPKDKTPSKRLRAVFYRLWEQNNESYSDFNLYYMHKMEKVISHYKSFLE